MFKKKKKKKLELLRELQAEPDQTAVCARRSWTGVNQCTSAPVSLHRRNICSAEGAPGPVSVNKKKNKKKTTNLLRNGSELLAVMVRASWAMGEDTGLVLPS